MAGTAIYDKQTTVVDDFVDHLLRNSYKEKGGQTVFDSAACVDTLNSCIHRSNDASNPKIPDSLQVMLDEAGGSTPEDSSETKLAYTQAILDSIGDYESMHGEKPAPDVIAWALQQGYSQTHDARSKLTDLEERKVFDSIDRAISDSSTSTSLNASRPLIAIMSSVAEAFPGATYLPADINTGKAQLIFLSHMAGSDMGGYKQEDSLDGINSGRPYINAARMTKIGADGKGKITLKQKAGAICDCDPAGTVAKLLRGRTEIYVNGLFVARETKTNTDTATIGGSFKFKDVNYVVQGQVKPDLAEITVAFTPALPADTAVHAKGFIDFERQPELVPLFKTDATSEELYATSWYAQAEYTQEAKAQIESETGYDVLSEGLVSMRAQLANERHNHVLDLANLLAINNSNQGSPFDFNHSMQLQNKTRRDAWVDFSPVLESSNQKCAEMTMDHGLSLLYVDSLIKSQWEGLPEIFTPSGLTARPGIYWIGTLFKKYKVYYNPNHVKSDVVGASRILGIGKSDNPARNPFILGDAIAPTLLPFGFNNKFRGGVGFFGKSFTQTNPHIPSALSCAYFDVINIPQS